MKQALISVVVPVFKVEKYIRRCVDSIVGQSFTDFELILVDDGSPDRCGEICDEYAQKDARIRVIHQTNGGLSAARNSGIEIAQGEWITFIDSDDWVHPDYLRALYEAVVNCNVNISVGRYERVREDCSVNSDRLDPEISLDYTEDFWVKNRINATVAWGKLYRRSLFVEIRYPLRKIDEDEYTTYKILFKNEEIAIVNSPIYWYFQNSNSITSMNYIRIMDDVVEAFYEQLRFFKNSGFEKAYTLSIEEYAASISEGIWEMRADKTGRFDIKLIEMRNKLKSFLNEHPKKIPFEKRKDIYISAYPKHELFIRGFGFIKQKLLK